jgi:hypothetical protein
MALSLSSHANGSAPGLRQSLNLFPNLPKGEVLNTLSNSSQGKWQNPEWISRVRELALAYPEWGCDRIAYYLVLKGLSISGPTVQRILSSQGLGSVSDRMGESQKIVSAQAQQVMESSVESQDSTQGS